MLGAINSGHLVNNMIFRKLHLDLLWLSGKYSVSMSIHFELPLPDCINPIQQIVAVELNSLLIFSDFRFNKLNLILSLFIAINSL